MATGEDIKVTADIHANVEKDSDEVEATDGTRQRKLTEKGLTYTLETKRRRLDQLCRGLEKHITYCQELILDDQEPDEDVKKNYKRWINYYDEFLEVDRTYRTLLTKEQYKEYDENFYYVRDQVFNQFKVEMEKWFAARPEPKVLRRQPMDIDNISEVSSSKSHKSRSSVVAARIEQEQKAAELVVRTAALKKKRQIEEAKLSLKLKEEEQQLEEEIAVNTAKSKVLDDIERHSQAESKSTTSHNSKDSHEALMSMVRHLNKPTSEVKKFGGNPLEYQHFLRQFKTRVASNCEDFDEKINYLQQYTTGDANRIVVGYSYLEAETGYTAALKELDERYGDADVIVNAFIKKALTWPVIKPDNPKGLDDFSIFLVECEYAVQNLEAIRVLEYSDNFRKIVSKLPYTLHDRWRGLVQETKERGHRVKFSTLVKFVRKEAKKVNDPTFGRVAMSSELKDQNTKYTGQTSSRGHKAKGSFATKITDVKDEASSETMKADNPLNQKKMPENKQNAFSTPCAHCNGSHALESCTNITTLPYYDRTEMLKTKGYCWGCLRFGHQRKLCKNKATCKHCEGRHPSILHIDGKLPPREDVMRKDTTKDEVQKKLSASACTDVSSQRRSTNGTEESECTMAIIPVSARFSGSSKVIETYAFLDPGSNVTFCADKLMHQLGAEGRRMKLTMDTMGESHTMYTNELRGLEISDLNRENIIMLPAVYTKNRMPVSKEHIPTAVDIQHWPHLRNIPLPQIDADIGLLIGNNVPEAYSPLEISVGPRGSPHATRTELGWIAWNVLRDSQTSYKTVNRADVTAIERIQELRDLNKLYKQSVNIDFPEKTIEDRKEYSQEDKRFIEKIAKSKTIVNNHYELCLPFRNQAPALPDNQHLAMNRLQSLKKKLIINSQFYDDYSRFMETLLENGHAERVPEAELQRADGKTWYLPHHGVYHPKKPQKIRVVFDCSARYKGVSLNDVLLQGPDLTNSLIGVLLKFRQDPIAVKGDIEKMFHQVKVSKGDRDCLRFYWWPNGNLHADPIIYRMVVHIFGATSSPSCASYALRQTVQDNKVNFNQLVTETAMQNFYVDDFLCSVDTEKTAIQLINGISSICQMGGFHITKWVTNSRMVLESIEEQDRAKEFAELDFENCPTERALGITWDVETDTIGFQIVPKSCDITRRSVLSIVSSVYDPLGIVAPYILPAKVLLQDLCRREVDWDTKLSESDLQIWLKWMEDLPELQNISVQRCLKPSDFGKVTNIQLHHFADASEMGYGIVTYIRFTDNNGQIHCSLLMGKSRVAPLKKITIPRMELTAATLAVKMHKMITSELDYQIDEIYFWTDSMAVIRYVVNESTRFHTFVANRINVIREGSDVNQWRYVKGNLNPADFASRGLTVNDHNQTKRWIEGPLFLWKQESAWPKDPDEITMLPEDDPEVKRSVNVAVVQKSSFIDGLLNKFSDLMKTRKTVAWVLVAVKCLRSWTDHRKTLKQEAMKSNSNVVEGDEIVDRHMTQLKREATTRSKQQLKTIFLPVDMLQKADTVLIRHVQQQYFTQELKDLSTVDSCIKRSSPLYKLDPFLCDGIIRVGGRLDHSSLSFDSKHQIVLPQDSELSKLILRDIHRTVGHQGKNAMLAELHKRYWIPRAGSIIKSIVSKCVCCRKYQAGAEEQKMADLPEDRTIAGMAPFSHVGMDYFGPIEVKRGRTTVKRYGVLFTCLASRAVHLEVANSLDTDSCINAIRRFLARRGPIVAIRSDNGTNLVGAERELREEIQQWNLSQIGRTLQQQSIKWDFNPPAGSHFGGVWERLIRSVRKILYSLLHEQAGRLEDESLHTLFCEIEHILNSRPITSPSNDPNDLGALTPNHLLLLRSNDTLPPGVFESADNYARRKWRQVQHLANIFWKRWLREYLPLLQKRQKWLKPHRNVAVNDVVLIMDKTPRNSWSMGRILSVQKDRKGLVRIVTVKTKQTVLQRPVDKLCLILEADLEPNN